MLYPTNREAALTRLNEFIPLAAHYGSRRNRVAPGHEAVSRLSPAIRCRLITEYEVADRVLAAHGLAGSEKFLQEVYWRSYWKGWLEMRPQVWEHYRREVRSLGDDAGVREACQRLEDGQTGIEPIDSFARELTRTGYLHNHARMWFASYWIHAARLPWQLGADYFYRHLLDADPASNTLSWRWVAGLQTPGKTYLVTPQNIEQFCAPELPRRNLEALEGLQPVSLPPETTSACAPAVLPPASSRLDGPIDGALGIWLHGDDLSIETSPLARARPRSICAICALDLFEGYRLSEPRQDYMQGALCDAIRRAGEHFDIAPECHARPNLARTILDWARDHDLRHVAALRPTVGPLGDCVAEIEALLSGAGIRMHWVRRPEDDSLWPLARRGFFPFWEDVRRQLVPEQ